MRLTVYLLALLAAHPFEWIAAGQVRGAGVMGFGGLLGHGDIGHHHENEELEDTGAKSTKKKDDTHKGTGNDYEESSEDGDALVDDEVPADDDGATDDVGGTPPDGDDTPTPPDGFQLRDLFFPCELIESQFELPVSCELDVVDALLSEGSVGITVDLNDRVCTPSILNRNACVSPIYSAYFGIFNLAISSRVDFTNITVGEFALGDVGLELEACGTDSETDNFFAAARPASMEMHALLVKYVGLVTATPSLGYPLTAQIWSLYSPVLTRAKKSPQYNLCRRTKFQFRFPTSLKSWSSDKESTYAM